MVAAPGVQHLALVTQHTLAQDETLLALAGCWAEASGPAQCTESLSASQGFRGSGSKRLAVEVPLADMGAQATAQLAADLLARLPAELARSFTLVFADVEAALSARHQATALRLACMQIRSCCSCVQCYTGLQQGLDRRWETCVTVAAGCHLCHAVVCVHSIELSSTHVIAGITEGRLKLPALGVATGASDLVENAVLPLDACEGEDLAGALMVVGAEVEQVCGNCCL